MSQPKPKTSRIPAPIYAVAGAGDLAYQKLRKLPVAMTQLTGRASLTTTGIRDKAVQGTAELRERAASRADLDRLRVIASRNRDAVLAGAQTAGQRAVRLYGTLVAHGERVVGTGVVRAADTVNADMEATEAPAQVAATPTASAAATAAATNGATVDGATSADLTADLSTTDAGGTDTGSTDAGPAKPAKRNRPSAT
ncbi:hypothetical protein O7632_29630 [Solwaraspora sp. WMMD406]|uniref:hypothetical protein n=1 Tax=Solwaraspora sp. WMMD406 TaxID=3016095 RepID=UPI002415CCDB|nr:hypothetical protein [Solwaraspora sp. WMMD406]MDG4768219.1 hypothetical protein [Solwaraspora sp. WMMD406]